MGRAMRLLLLALLAAPALAAEPRVLVADPEPIVQVRIRDSALPVRVALGVPRALLLNAEPAIETGIRPFPIVGKLRFSNALLPGGSALVRFNRIGVGIDGAPKRKLPTAWIEPEITGRTAGVLSIFAFEGDRIAWVNPRAPAGGQSYTLARDGTNDPDVMVQLGGETIRLTFAPDSPVTIMNARAAAALEAEGLVRRGNQVGLWEPIPRARLPWQALVPSPGAAIAGLPLVRPAARVSEAEARAIDARAEAGTSTAEDDADTVADTIVVKGQRQGRRGRRPWILVGADVLDRCSRIELDRPGRVWRLTCAF